MNALRKALRQWAKRWGTAPHWHIYKDESGGWIIADAPKGQDAAKAVWMPSHPEAIAMADTLLKGGV